MPYSHRQDVPCNVISTFMPPTRLHLLLYLLEEPSLYSYTPKVRETEIGKKKNHTEKYGQEKSDQQLWILKGQEIWKQRNTDPADILFQIKHIWHIWLLLSTGIRRYKRKADMTHIYVIAQTKGRFYLLLGWRQSTSFMLTVGTSHCPNPLRASELPGGLWNDWLAGQ